MKTAEQSSREYLMELQQQFDVMTDREKVVNGTVVLIGRTITEILTAHDIEALTMLREMVNDLFKQADTIMQQGPKHLQ